MKCHIATRCIAASAGQDRVWARVFDDLAIVAIADGAGGRAGGGEAAEIVVREAARTAQDVRDAKTWARWLSGVDSLIRDAEMAGETTAIIAAIGANYVSGASVGDSSVWLVGARSWHDLSENQVRKPPLGVGGSPVAFSARLDDETLLFASDGLTKYADWDIIANIARGKNIETAADELIESVRYPSGALADDVSCVLCRVESDTASIPRRKRFGLF